MENFEKGHRLRKALALMLSFLIVLTFFPQEALGMVYDWKVGETAYFKNGAPLRGSDGNPYYNYHTSGQRYAYCIAPINGGKSIRGYCLERNMDNPHNGNTKYYAKLWNTALRIGKYSDDVQTAIKIALLYSKQPQSNTKDLQKLLSRYDSRVKECNLDDWWLAAQTIIWEFTDGYRKSISGIPQNLGAVENGKIVLGTVNAGEGYDFHYRVLKGRPARYVYYAMLRAMKNHRMIPSFTGNSEKNAKTIHMEKVSAEGEEPVWRSGILTDKNQCKAAFRVVTTENGKLKTRKDIEFISQGGNQYILEYRGETLPDKVYRGKKDLPEAMADELLVWQNSPSSTPLQTIAIGGADPVNFYFTLKGKKKEEQQEPKLPSFTFNTEKRDFNSGWDQASGTSGTGMGDAPLDSEISLYIDGVQEDTRTLSIYGATEGEPFVFMPWKDISELTTEEVPVYDDAGQLLYTDYYWKGKKTVSTAETKVPDGRYPESQTGGTGKKSHGDISYFAHCRDAGPIDYRITYEGADGSGAVLTDEADIDPENPQQMRDETGTFAYVNDNFRGELQIVKTKDDLDPFTDAANSEGGGVKDYSTKSYWTIRLESGGWEGCPYVRVKDEGRESAGYGRFTHKYRATRDNSGTPADEANPLTVFEDGQIYIYDLPYGTYVVSEIKADSEGYVLESFRITVSEDGQKISKTVNNQAKRNRIKIVKTNAETGKIVRWDADRTAFQIRYMGRPDLADPSKSPNYGKWLPSIGSYTDDTQDYTFYADANGEIRLPYDLEYGIYEIQELVVPHGYFVGQYDEKGKGSIANMGEVKIVNHKGETVRPPKTFLQTVQVRDGDGNPVKSFAGNSDMTYNTYTFSVTEQDSHEDGKGYTTYYVPLEIANLPAKGKVRIIKEGQILTGWNSGKDGIFTPVWGKKKLKGTRYEIYAAKDVKQSDGIIPVQAFFTENDEEVQLEKMSRDHAGKADAKEIWGRSLNGGSEIRRVSDKGLIKDFGKANTTITEYLTKADSGAVYQNSFSVRDEDRKMTYHYKVEYKLNYVRGGFNYTDVHVWKTSVSDDYTAEIETTEPVLTTGELEIGISTMNYEGGNLVKANRLSSEQGLPDEEVTGIQKGYRKEDITAKPVKKDEAELQEVEKPVGWEDVQTEDTGDFYMVTDGQGAYQIFAVDGLQKRWIPCDEKGNFYKSYEQEYDFLTAQHYGCSDGFSFDWDDVISMKAWADHENQKAVTEIRESNRVTGASPIVEEVEDYSHERNNGKVIFTAAPKVEAPVFFKTHDGIRTEMYLAGGLSHTRITVLQSQLCKFDRMLPAVTYDGEEIPWNQNLGPENSFFEKIYNDSNYLKAERHKPGHDVSEVYYTIDLVSDCSSDTGGFKIIYPDTTTAIVKTAAAGQRAVLRFSSVDETMVYPMGSPVEIIETGDDGTAESRALPLGEYWVREIFSGTGHINRGTWQKIKLEYKDQYTPLLWDTAHFENEAVSVRIDLEKLFETDFESGTYAPGSGAVFGVYTAEEIKAENSEADTEGRTILPANTLVGRMTVEHGQASAAIKLPLGKYYIKEISAPQGYKTNHTKYYFEAVDILTADQMSFRYQDEGIIGHLTQNGNKGVTVDFDVLYRFTESKVQIDDKTFSIDKNAEDGNVRVTPLDGRTNIQIKLEDGQEAVIHWENGASLTVQAEGQNYTALFAGTKPSELKTGADENENFTVSDSEAGTLVCYTPKVSRTNWLSEVVCRYVPAKEHPTDEEEETATALELTSPAGTSKVTAKVDGKHETAEIICSAGEVTKILVHEEELKDLSKSFTLNRESSLAQTGQAVICFADGVTFTAEFDREGNFYMSASGAKEGKLSGETVLTVDGSSELPKKVSLKNTTAKTYARNNTEATVLNITINNVKNDRLPEKPTVPEKPEVPDKPEIPEKPEQAEIPEKPKKIPAVLKLMKVDGTSGKALAGAVFELYDQDYHLLLSGKTDGKGIWKVPDLAEGKYYYREIEAPAGYVRKGDVRSFYVTGDEKPIEIIVENQRELTRRIENPDIPKTGDGNQLMIYLALAILAISAVVVGHRKFK